MPARSHAIIVFMGELLSAFTETEKRQQKADLLLACSEAEQEVAHLAERASFVKSMLREICTALEEAQPKKTTCGVPEVEDRLGRIKAARLEKIKTEAKYREAMSLDSVLLLLDMLERAKSSAEELYERKIALGLR